MIIMTMVMLIFAILAGFAALAVLVAAASAVGGAALAAGDNLARELSKQRARRNGEASGTVLEWAGPTAMPDYAPCLGFQAPMPGPAYAGRWVFDPLNIEEPVWLDDTVIEAPMAAPEALLSEEEPAADSLEDLGAYILTR